MGSVAEEVHVDVDAATSLLVAGAATVEALACIPTGAVLASTVGLLGADGLSAASGAEDVMRRT